VSRKKAAARARTLLAVWQVAGAHRGGPVEQENKVRFFQIAFFRRLSWTEQHQETPA
jgi:hypothetical protein